MINHQNNFATNLTIPTFAGATTSPLDSIPTVDAPFYIAFDATNANSHYEVLKCTSKTATNVNHPATAYDHTAAEEVRMVLPAEELDSYQTLLNGGGWVTVDDTWTYASATTITVPSGAASIYQKGDKIRFQNNNSGTYLYAHVTGVADTVLTVIGDAVPNAALTDVYYSKTDNPQGFPSSFAFAFTLVGAGGSAGTYAQTLNVGRIKIYAGMCQGFVNLQVTNKGSWSGVVSMNLPVDMNTALASDVVFNDLAIVAAAGNPYTAAKGKAQITTTSNPDTITWTKTMGTAQVAWTDLAINDTIYGQFSYPI